MYDVMIVGAGPAGSNLARLIGDKYSVLIVDKGIWEERTQTVMATASAAVGCWPLMRRKCSQGWAWG